MAVGGGAKAGAWRGWPEEGGSPWLSANVGLALGPFVGVYFGWVGWEFGLLFGAWMRWMMVFSSVLWGCFWCWLIMVSEKCNFMLLCNFMSYWINLFWRYVGKNWSWMWYCKWKDIKLTDLTVCFWFQYLTSWEFSSFHKKKDKTSKLFVILKKNCSNCIQW